MQLQVVANLTHVVLGMAAERVIGAWCDSGSPPTWRAFLDVLQTLGLEELSRQIEEYLSGKFDVLSQSPLTAIPVDSR